MKRNNLLNRLKALKAGGIEIIFTSESKMLYDIPTEKLMDRNILIIKTNHSISDIEKEVEKIEGIVENSMSISIFEFLKSNL